MRAVNDLPDQKQAKGRITASQPVYHRWTTGENMKNDLIK